MIKRKLSILIAIFFAITAQAQFNPGNAIKEARKQLPGNQQLTNQEVVEGLKEALTVGTSNAATMASKADGFYKNPEIFIPFPPEAANVQRTAENLGMKKQVEEFVHTLNRAAEEAAKEAAPIFVSAIKQMSVNDGFTILRGENNAATVYLESKTSEELHALFLPIVKSAIEKVEVTKYWNPLITNYNRFPSAQKVDPDLNAYVTQKALDGIFVLLAKEEMKIRQDPAARVNDILKKVFGS